MADPSPVHLRTFLAVARHLSYTRAAREIFLSQPAVSRQIQQLEADLGVSLFERIGRQLHLTGAGQSLEREAAALLAHLERVAESVALHRSAGAGRVRIGAGTTPGTYLLPPVIERFHRRRPELELDYVVGRSRRVEQMILRNEADLGFIGGPPSSAELVSTVVARDEIHCFCGPSHDLASRRRLRPSALSGQRWIAREAGSATRELFEAWLAGQGIAARRSTETASPEAVRTLVAAGLGLGYMSRLALEEDYERGRLARLGIAGLNLRRSIHMVRHRDKRVSPALAEFIKEAGRTLRFTPPRSGEAAGG